MGLSDLQSHILQSIPDVTELVDLLGRPRDAPLQLVVDGECCLDRLYGGYFPDWVCGGQWNKMEQFLCNFSSAVQNSKLDLVVFLNGSLETERLNEWCKRQEETHKFLQEIHQHVSIKRKPPPKIWWIPPAFARSAIRLAFRGLNMKIMCSLEDHRKDVLRFMKKNHFNGIAADDSEYLAFEPDRYVSAKNLKLTFKGSLETVEMKLNKVATTLNIPKDRFHIFATLLGNHIVLETDLIAFYSSLEIQESQQKAAVIEAVAQFVRTLETTDRGRVVDLVLQKSHSETATHDSLQALRENLLRSLKYYGTINAKNPIPNNARSGKSPSAKNVQKEKTEENASGGDHHETEPSTAESVAASVLPSDSQNLEDSNVFEDCDGSGCANVANSDGATVPKIPFPVMNGSGDAPAVDVKPKCSAEVSSFARLLYRVVPQIENVAVNRHRSGLMSPYICQILKYKEIKLPVLIEDVKGSTDLPHAHFVFRPLRQRVYAILFNLHHLHFLAKERGESVPKIEVKETYYDPITKQAKTDLVRAVEVGWGVPTIERLWLGEGDECKRKRVRAFLSTMKSDKQIFLDSSVVPQHLLVLCCVLRFLAFEKKLLRQTEFDGLIAQALIQELTDVNVAQDIEVSNLTMRGIHIAHLFMEGVEMALLVNDACGSPIPYRLFAPWLFFNGKIFNFILEEQNSGKTIAEICGFKMEIVYNMERLKVAILDGINVQLAPNPYTALTANVPLLNSYLHGQYGRHPAQGYGGNNGLPVRRNAGGLGGNPGVLRNAVQQGLLPGYSQYENGGGFGYQNTSIPRNTQFSMGEYERVSRRGQSRGAQLQVAGTVVGSWGASANYSQPSTSRHHISTSPAVYRFSQPQQTYMNYGRRTGYGYEHNSNVPMDAAFRQMRISQQGNKVPIRAASSNSWNAWNSRAQQLKQHKKPIMKNENSVSVSNGDAAGTSKSKGVSFMDEPHSIPTNRNGEASLGIPE